MNTKIFNDWNVQLAKTYKPGMIKENTWFSISQKINGTRATFFAGKLISRTGHEFLGLEHIINELQAIITEVFDGHNHVFDGELRLAPQYCQYITDNEAFRIGNGIANAQKTRINKNKLIFIIFDLIKSTWFIDDACWQSYRHRLEKLNYLKEYTRAYCNFVQIVPIMYAGQDINQIEIQSETAYHLGYEGIMINLDRMYEYKRSSGLLKYKKFNTIDLKIVGFQEGTGKYEDMLGAFICEYKGNTLFVGSGMNDDLRYHAWHHKEDYFGKIIEVKYKDISHNKETGMESLQFPIFLQVRTDKTEADV